MRVCVLANSHVYMLKMAADDHPPVWTPTFFGAPAGGLRWLKRLPKRQGLYTRKARIRRWIVRTSGGLDRIDYQDYDAFVVVGLNLRTHDALAWFGKYQTAEHHIDPAARLISEAAFRDMIRAHLEASAAWRVMRLLANAGDKPVLVIPAPFPHPAIGKRRAHSWVARPDASAAVGWINQTVHDEYRKAVTAMGYRFAVQPPETVGSDNLTAEEFSRDAANLSGRTYQERDVSHMNAEFGRIMLDLIGRELATKEPRPPT